MVNLVEKIGGGGRQGVGKAGIGEIGGGFGPEGGQGAAGLIEKIKIGIQPLIARQFQGHSAKIYAVNQLFLPQLQRLHVGRKIVFGAISLVSVDEEGGGIGGKDIFHRIGVAHGQAQLTVGQIITAQIGQMVAEKDQQGGPGQAVQILDQLADHCRRVTTAPQIDRKLFHGLVTQGDVGGHGRGGVGIFVIFIALVILNGDGVDKLGRLPRLDLRLELAEEGGILDKAAHLVRGVKDRLEGLLLNAEIFIHTATVIKPAITRMHKAIVIALIPQNRGNGGQSPVDHPEGGGGPFTDHSGGQAGENVKLRIGGAGGNVGNRNMARQGLLALGELIVEVNGIVLFGGPIKHVGVGDIAEGLPHHHNNIRRRFGGCDGLGVFLHPALHRLFIVILRLFHRIEIGVVQKAVVEAQGIEHRGNIVGIGHRIAVVNTLSGIHKQHTQGKQSDGAHASHYPQIALGGGAEEKAHGHQPQAQADDGHQPPGMQVQRILGSGVERLLKQADIGGHEGVLPALNFQKVDIGQQGPEQGGNGATPPHVARDEISQHQSDQHGKPVEQKQPLSRPDIRKGAGEIPRLQCNTQEQCRQGQSKN